MPCGRASKRVATWHFSHGVEGRRRAGPAIYVHQCDQRQGSNDIPKRGATVWPPLVLLHVNITQFVSALAGSSLFEGF